MDVGLAESSLESGSNRTQSNTLSIHRASLLKHLLRSIHRLMHASGTTEALRGLIDSSLVKSITLIMENRALFGPSILPMAINIMTAFIHNEPTSLHVLQEARVPEAFYETVESGLEPVLEVIQSVPNALGALCLNQAGASQLVERPQVLGRFFDIFTSRKHVKLLQEKDNAVIVGTALDELVRHHPTLGDHVFAAIASTLDRIEALGHDMETDFGQKHLYGLVLEAPKDSIELSSGASTLDPLPNQDNDQGPMDIEGSAESVPEDCKSGNPVLASFEVFNRVSMNNAQTYFRTDPF